jgi:wyosine [tRNA(Phe)-imidazoG37] synthetase (radical SAM superfamily)
MLIRDVNDGDAALVDIAAALARGRPDAVHLNLPVRSAAVAWVRAGRRAGSACVDDPGRECAGAGIEMMNGGTRLETMLGIIARHLLREAENAQRLRDSEPGDVHRTLLDLEQRGQIQMVVRDGQRFWGALGADVA